MLNLPRLARLAVAGDFDRMLEEVSRNGRPLSLQVRLRLSEPDALTSAALGLALQRVVQLTYRPTPVSIALARALVGQRRPDGGFGTLAATGVALAALLAFADQVAGLPGGRDPSRGVIDPELHREVHESIAAALHRLHRGQEESPAARLGEPPSLIGDELDSAIILWQLGLEPRFASVVRFHDLLAAVEQQGLRHERATRPLLDQLASSRSPLVRPTTPERSSAA